MMNKTKLYRGLRVDLKHFEAIQGHAEDGLQLDALAALRRTDSPALPSAAAGALSGFTPTYDPGTTSLVLAGSVGATRSLALDPDGTLLELLTDSDPVDLAVFAPGTDPFVIWAQKTVLDTDDDNVVIYTPGVGETIQAKKMVARDTLSFLALAPGAPAPDATWFPVRDCSSWNVGVPVTRLCGPLRDQTAHSVALDLQKPVSLLELVMQLGDVFHVEHEVGPGSTNPGRHTLIQPWAVQILDLLGTAHWALSAFGGDLLLAGGAGLDLVAQVGGTEVARLSAAGELSTLGEYAYQSRKTFTEAVPTMTWRHDTYGLSGDELWDYYAAHDMDVFPKWFPGGNTTTHGSLLIPLRVPTGSRLLSFAVNVHLVAPNPVAANLEFKLFHLAAPGADATEIPVNEATLLSITASTYDGWCTINVTAPFELAAGEEIFAKLDISGDYTGTYLSGAQQTIDCLHVRP
ncbi:MAG: hypothetical protein RBU45_23175 [Myxococcota bacterium]|jgi:hypothetical protein|nr:hypothetical protein [Myxococcota bacterium]